MSDSREEILNKIKLYKDKLIGKKLKKVLHTDQGEGIIHLEGLWKAYYFSTVLELEDGTKYQFNHNWISEWDNNEDLIEITHENWGIPKNIKFNNLSITDILIDEDDEIYIKLENDILIYHTIDYGDKLFINTYSTLFDKNGNLLMEEFPRQDRASITKKSSNVFLKLLRKWF